MTLHSTSEAVRLSGVTLRQVDWWVRNGSITPTVGASGSGTRRKWSDEDVQALTAMGRVAEAIRLEAIGDVYRRVGEDARRSSPCACRDRRRGPVGRHAADDRGGRVMDRGPNYPTTPLGEWTDLANCEGMDPDLFFPPKNRPELLREARLVCATCVVRTACLRFALDNGITHGIWGGASERERARMRRRERLARKTA